MNLKRILSLIAVAILVILYILTLVFAIIGSPNSLRLFMVSAVCTVMIPIIVQIFLTINNVRRGKSILDNPYPYKDATNDKKD